MRLRFPRRAVCASFATALVCVMGAACATPAAVPRVGERVNAVPTRAEGPPVVDGNLRAARELAAALPRDADRCLVVMPERAPAAERPLVALVSQLDRLPWTLGSRVTAYARAELTPHGDRRRVVELVRFGAGSRAQIRQELTQQAAQAWSWDGEPVACDDPLTCVTTHAEFLDAHTVRIRTGDWPYDGGTPASDCSALLERVPEAAEVSARRGRESSELGLVERWLTVTNGGLTHVELRAYADAGAAERAQLKQLAGYQDQTLVAGVPVKAQLVVDANTLSQTSNLAWEDLLLVLQDRERLRGVLAGAGPAGLGSDERVDVADAELVRAHVDARIDAIASEAPEHARDSLRSLRDLLLRARGVHAADEGLARRLFALCMYALAEPREALAVADSMIRRGSLRSANWELSQRTALAHVDPARLRSELGSAHGLSAAEAGRMAASLAASVQRGEDYERAEWAFLMARSLSQRAHGTKLIAAPEVPLGPGLATRVLSTLCMAAAESASSPIGVHVVMTGSGLDQVVVQPDAVLWAQRTDALGAEAVVVAATSWDVAQMLSLARTLDALAQVPAVELWIAFEPLQKLGRAGTVVRLSFHREESGLVLDRVSKNLAHVRWPKVVREVADPLSRLQGSMFPPDSLSIEASSTEELSAWSAAAASVDGVHCAIDGVALQCQGTLHDSLAAERALRAIVRVSLGPEVRIFTSGVE